LERNTEIDMIIHGRKQISEIVYARKASDGGGAIRLSNIIRGPQVVFGGLETGPFPWGWLTGAACGAILGAFGVLDGKAVIKATNAYLNQLAATDPTKASALAGFINEDPMMVCSLGLEVEGVTMPVRWLVSDGSAWIDSGIGTDANTPLDMTFMMTDRDNDHCSFCGNGTFEVYFWGRNIEFHCSSNFNVITNNEIGEKYRLKCENGTYTFWRDDVVASTGSRTLGSTQSRSVALFALNRGSIIAIGRTMIGDMLLGTKHFVPYKHKINDTTVNGMLDLEAVGVDDAQTWYPNAGTGQFTIPDISYTPQTPNAT
jgi:hypothetical protein